MYLVGNESAPILRTEERTTGETSDRLSHSAPCQQSSDISPNTCGAAVSTSSLRSVGAPSAVTPASSSRSCYKAAAGGQVASLFGSSKTKNKINASTVSAPMLMLCMQMQRRRGLLVAVNHVLSCMCQTTQHMIVPTFMKFSTISNLSARLILID